MRAHGCDVPGYGREDVGSRAPASSIIRLHVIFSDPISVFLAPRPAPAGRKPEEPQAEGPGPHPLPLHAFPHLARSTLWAAVSSGAERLTTLHSVPVGRRPAGRPCGPANRLPQGASSADFFQTPDALADEMVELAGIEPGQRILDPSAGTGSLLRAARRKFGLSLTYAAVEVNHAMAADLRERLADEVHHGDFLGLTPARVGRFPRILIHPPLAHGADVPHILHALGFLEPGGRLVGICADGASQGRILRPLVEARGGVWLPLSPHLFTGVGTRMRAVLFTLAA